MSMFDLHVHTTASDGHFSPLEIVDKARVYGLKALAITDHDTTNGIEEAIAAGKEKNIIIIPGIELSTDYQGKEIHILGYFMDYHAQEFQVKLMLFRDDRKLRAQKIVTKLNTLGYEILFEDVLVFSQGGTIGRPHIAQALLAKGAIKTAKEAFDKLIGRDKPAYVPRQKLTPHEAVMLIRDFNGIPVMAHPGLAGKDNIIPELTQSGLMGIEVFHPDHKLHDIIKYQIIAKENNLLITGGSDFHGNGSHSKSSLGVSNADYSIVTDLLLAKERLNNANC